MAKARALLIGINYQTYESKPSHLHGCIHDVHSFQDFLSNHVRLQKKNVKTLTDEISTQDVSWTSVMLAIHDLCVASWKEELELAVFYFSGHGIQLRDTNQDEADGLDEGIAPYDYNKYGAILDDHLKRLFLGFNPRTRVVCIFDSSHSGSIMDQPFTYMDGLDVSTQFVLDPEIDEYPHILVLSGCKDKEVCGDDTQEGGVTMGTFTRHLLKVLIEFPDFPILDVQKKVNYNLKCMGEVHPIGYDISLFS